MGLSASQARLLTITSRKSDCEYQSMRYSHQKISLSREMTDISNAYQNSLNQTKLVYDFYGKGDTSTQLSYGLLMNPSALNNYTPTLITDTAGKVVLDGKLAAAARAAGIPQEGLGCLPSDTLRNKFIQGLADNGMITQELSDLIQKTQYNQTVGNGGSITSTVILEQGNINALIDKLRKDGTTLNPATIGALSGTSGIINMKLINGSGNTDGSTNHLDDAKISMADILSGDYRILCEVNDNFDTRGNASHALTGLELWDWMNSELMSALDTGDPYTQQALEYAKSKTENLLDLDAGWGYGLSYRGKTKEKDRRGYRGVINAMNGDGKNHYNAGDYIGMTIYRNTKSSGNNRSDGVAIDVSNIARSFLTYFAQFMEGTSVSKYNVDEKVKNANTMIDDFYMFSFVADTQISGDTSLLAASYDTIFNQLCQRGWTENSSINNNLYLQEMLQNGNMYVTKMKDDGYYYQGNYSTDTYIREITDDDAIAKAEAKYENEKQKINQKEQIIDLKMKNLDTEISSLTTEYDTVKNVISKNIEKVFKRYQA